eukprot:COSAG02_NODE_3485_length_6664_cov_3.752323_6_plen_65_part_00
MDEKIFLRTHRSAHQSKRLALSFSLHFSFSAAELIQAFYRPRMHTTVKAPIRACAGCDLHDLTE